jgi:hypothetical protein
LGRALPIRLDRSMFAKQAQQIKVLFEVLKSNDLIKDDDVAAFTDIVQVTSTRALSEETYDRYASFCNKRGITYQPSN